LAGRCAAVAGAAETTGFAAGLETGEGCGTGFEKEAGAATGAVRGEAKVGEAGEVMTGFIGGMI